MTLLSRVEALWFEPGAAADAAAAINAHRARVKHVSPDWVRKQWKSLQDMGRLPNFVRPPNGFSGHIGLVLKRLMTVDAEKAA